MSRYIAAQKCYRVKAVVWCVEPKVRMTPGLQSQAKIIDMLTEGEDAGKIWSNVLIICRGSPGRNADVEADWQGAVMAAKSVYPAASPRTVRSVGTTITWSD